MLTIHGLNSLNQSINAGISTKDVEKSEEYVNLLNQGFVFYGNYGRKEYDSLISGRYDSNSFCKNFEEFTSGKQAFYLSKEYERVTAIAYYYGNPSQDVLKDFVAVFARRIEP